MKRIRRRRRRIHLNNARKIMTSLNTITLHSAQSKPLIPTAEVPLASLPPRLQNHHQEEYRMVSHKPLDAIVGGNERRFWALFLYTCLNKEYSKSRGASVTRNFFSSLIRECSNAHVPVNALELSPHRSCHTTTKDVAVVDHGRHQE